MKLSNYFLPTLKEEPREAQIASHKLMIRAGMIRQLTSGIYIWLPFGLKVLKNIENIIQKELSEAGAIQLLMPTMQPAELWKKSGRGNYGKETLVATDRHGNNLIYGPTNEEVISDLFASNVKSHKDLPLNLYQMQWKFRDEIRPRFGVMRGREFYMKDAYSFDVNEEGAIKSYNNMFKTYLKIFKKLGLKAIPVEADTGQIGGNLSHEFQIMAETGESQIYYDIKFDELLGEDDLSLDKIQGLYAKADEMHDVENCKVSKDDLKTARGIEVGHIFYLGDKYSAPMGAKIQGEDGKEVAVKMGCYGIGVSRLIAAIIESSHDDKGIIWPKSVSPFDVCVVNLKLGDTEIDRICEEIHKIDSNRILVDDTKDSFGAKISKMDLIGIPLQVLIGPKGVKEGIAEIRYRDTGKSENIALNDLNKFIKEKINE